MRDISPRGARHADMYVHLHVAVVHCGLTVGERRLYISAGKHRRIKRNATPLGRGNEYPGRRMQNMPIAKFAIRIHLWRDARSPRAARGFDRVPSLCAGRAAPRRESHYEAALDMLMAIEGKSVFFIVSILGRNGKGSRFLVVPLAASRKISTTRYKISALPG